MFSGFYVLKICIQDLKTFFNPQLSLSSNLTNPVLNLPKEAFLGLGLQTPEIIRVNNAVLQ